MGKSTAAGFLEQRGISVIDTDLLARELVQRGEPALTEIIGIFGDAILNPDGSLNRPELARQVFSNPGLRTKLEEILHPRIRKNWAEKIRELKSKGTPIAAVIIPLLFETGAEVAFTAVLCLACSSQTQLRRLQARGWSPDEIKKRIAAQWPVEKKIERSHFVIWTEGPLKITELQLDQILES
jgi:dephospho-CoA kinase